MNDRQEQIVRELEQVLLIATDLTGLPSRWTGALELVPAAAAVPLRERPGHVLALGYRQTRLPRAPFIRAFSAANAVLTRRPL